MVLPKKHVAWRRIASLLLFAAAPATSLFAQGLAFYPISPCRVVDTRQGQGKTGPFGPPSLVASATRDFPISAGSCNIPWYAQAYSLNFTAIPQGRLDYLSVWPAGQGYPNVSTLNSTSGYIIANAAIVPAGTNGAITIMAGEATDVLIDIDGYFASTAYVPSNTPYYFYAITPCRAVDTRNGQNKTGAFGPPMLQANASRDFPLLSSGCGVPASAIAYSLNFTVVPPGPLSFLSTWPTGQPYPNISTLNDAAGTTIANAAIVSAGTSGAITVLAVNPTDLIIDINGYFAPAGQPGAMSFYPVTPCRVVDTRADQGKPGDYGPPSLVGGTTRDFPIPYGGCDIPNGVNAAGFVESYSLNFTAVPPGPLQYLSAWPAGQPYPNVSTLNSPLGATIANAALVPAGQNGSVRVLPGNNTDLIIDANGFFATPTPPNSSTVVPFNFTSSAETLMFNATSTTPYVFQVVIENSGAYARNHYNVNASGACYIEYYAPPYGNILLLGSDQYGTWINPGGTTPGTAVQYSNSQCTLDVSRSFVQVVQSTGKMQVQLALTFKSTWAGPKEMYVDVYDANGDELYWTNRGSWTVPSTSQIAVTTDHYDVFRTGANVHETTLTPGNVGSLHQIATIPLSACAWAEPLYVPGVVINGVSKNILYVATADAKITAFDVDQNYQQVWSQVLGTPPPGGDGDIIDCNQLDKSGTNAPSPGPAGIVGTPVIDLSTNIMFVVGNIKDASNNPQHKIFSINITNGAVINSTVISWTGFSSKQQLQRSGLLLADYNVLVPFASYGDGRPYEGWMFSFNRNTLVQQDQANYSPDQDGAGIWMGAGGAAFDGRKVYATTGNNFSVASQAELSNSLLQVDPYQPGGLISSIGQFLPPQITVIAPGDVDLSSGRATLVPGTNYVLAGGKSGDIYILDRTWPIAGPPGNPGPTVASGGSLIGTFNVFYDANNIEFPITANTREIVGGLAYWKKTIYVSAGKDIDPFSNPPPTPPYCQGDVLRTFSLSAAVAGSAPQLQHEASPPPQAQNYFLQPNGSCEQGAPLSISANFDTNGLIWAVLPLKNEHYGFVPGQLRVYDATDLTQLKAPVLPLTYAMKFTPPLVANGKVYVVTAAPQIVVFGL